MTEWRVAENDLSGIKIARKIKKRGIFDTELKINRNFAPRNILVIWHR